MNGLETLIAGAPGEFRLMDGLERLSAALFLKQIGKLGLFLTFNRFCGAERLDNDLLARAMPRHRLCHLSRLEARGRSLGRRRRLDVHADHTQPGRR